MRNKRLQLMLVAVLIGFGSQSGAQDEAAESVFITLGTSAGPIPDTRRAQPSNVLTYGEDAYLIDAGDGAMTRLAHAGVPYYEVRAVFISHLHFDHTGGLGAFLGLRWQNNARGPLKIYGPLGTRRTIQGLFDYMRPMTEFGSGLTAERLSPPEMNVEIVELRDGARINIGKLNVIAAENTHFILADGTMPQADFESLSYRFDLPDRSIVYTGDTGPSEAVERLARDADMLVAEMMDVERQIGILKGLPRPPPDFVYEHLRLHHISPEQVGEMAKNANVGRLVITHFSPPVTEEEEVARYTDQVRAVFDGDVVIASDLDQF